MIVDFCDSYHTLTTLCKLERSWKIPIFGKFWQFLPKIGDFGHFKIWPKNGWKSTNSDPKIDFWNFLITLAHFYSILKKNFFLRFLIFFFSPNTFSWDYWHSHFSIFGLILWRLRMSKIRKKRIWVVKRKSKIREKKFFFGISRNGLKLSESSKNRFLDHYWSFFNHFSAKFWEGQNLQFWVKVAKICQKWQFFNIFQLVEGG